jgi:hypothetical protein
MMAINLQLIFLIPISTFHITSNNSDYPIEKRRRSQIIRERKAKTDLMNGEPPNYEVGWKRSKEIKLEEPVGYVIMDFVDKLVGLMDKEFGSTALLVKAGESGRENKSRGWGFER